MRLYHGTSPRNVARILREGFKVTPSDRMFLGAGVYFSTSREGAERYGPSVLEVELPPNAKVCQLEPGFALGVFEQWKEIEEEWREREGMKIPNEERLFRDYVRYAKEFQRDRLKEGCQVGTDGRQYVVYDPRLARKVRVRKVLLREAR